MRVYCGGCRVEREGGELGLFFQMGSVLRDGLLGRRGWAAGKTTPLNRLRPDCVGCFSLWGEGEIDWEVRVMN